MTDETQDLETIDLSAPQAGAGWPPGWYSDPWTAGQYRYWTGQSWTGETNRWGPTTTGMASGGASGAVTDPWPTAPAAATPMQSGYGGQIANDAAAPYAVAPRRRGPIIAAVIGLVLLLLVSGVVGYRINSSSQSDDGALTVPGPSSPSITVPSGNSPTTPSTTPSTAPASTDPDRGVLGGLVAQQSDVGAARTVMLIPNGNLISQPTLDLCNGNFPSEQLRTARLQVAVVNGTGNTLLSTEAVLYRDPAAAEQGLAELRKVRAECPDTPVVSPVNEATAQTTFKAAPDGTWPHTPSVDRQAYSFVTTSAGGKNASIAVYLRRGRALVGLYFLNPNAAPAPVAGQTTIGGIVGVFEKRLAQLPASVVNGP